MPIGVPEVLTDSELPSLEAFHAGVMDESLFGFSCITILPPGDLLIPVLPYRYNETLYFPLCRRCVVLGQLKKCTHDDYERALCGTFFTGELRLALELGYRLLRVHMHHQYQHTSDLFRQFIGKGLGEKIRSSPLPREYADNLEEYCRVLEERFDIVLQPESFKADAGLRLCSKLRYDWCLCFQFYL